MRPLAGGDHVVFGEISPYLDHAESSGSVMAGVSLFVGWSGFAAAAKLELKSVWRQPRLTAVSNFSISIACQFA